jgi:hypothetical protein
MDYVDRSLHNWLSSGQIAHRPVGGVRSGLLLVSIYLRNVNIHAGQRPAVAANSLTSWQLAAVRRSAMPQSIAD